MVHIYCDGGLGNRLLSLFSALHFVKKANKPFIIHWPSNNWCGCNFTDLFSNNYNVSNFNIKFIDEHILDNCVLLIHESQIDHRTENKIILNGRLSQKDMVKIMSDSSNVFYFGNCLHRSIDPDTIIEVIDELKLSNQILSKISEYDVLNHQGIHIRKTDYGKSPYITIDQLESEIKNNSDIGYFLCSDEEDVETKFKKNANVLSFKKTSYAEKMNISDGWKSESIDDSGRRYPSNVNRDKISSIEAFCDMILLAETSTRLKTSGSSFLTCADLISKTKLAKSKGLT